MMIKASISKSGYVVPARGGRPRGCLGESGHKVLLAVSDMVVSGDYVDGVTWRDVFNKLCANNYPASRRMVKEAMDNLARAGHIVKNGERSMQGAYKPLRVFVPAPPAGQDVSKVDALAAVMFGFCGAVPQ